MRWKRRRIQKRRRRIRLLPRRIKRAVFAALEQYRSMGYIAISTEDEVDAVFGKGSPFGMRVVESLRRAGEMRPKVVRIQ